MDTDYLSYHEVSAQPHIPQGIPDPSAPETTAHDMLRFPGMQDALILCMPSEYEAHKDMTDEELRTMVRNVGDLPTEETVSLA